MWQIGCKLLDLQFWKNHTTRRHVECEPNLVAKRDGQAVVLDAPVVSTATALSQLHMTKTMKYVDEALLNHTGERLILSSMMICY